VRYDPSNIYDVTWSGGVHFPVWQRWRPSSGCLVVERSHCALATGHQSESMAQAAMSDTHGGVNAGWNRSTRLGVYWVATVLVAFELVASFIWVVVGTQYVTNNLKHLGYPLFLAKIIGVFDFPGAVTLLIPGFTRLKEWAYAGAFFKYAGAVASHVFAGDGPDRWMPAFIFGLLTITSWTLRPPNRRMVANAPSRDQGALAWLVSLAILAGLVIVALFRVPA
jgi:hypothetical protein